MLIEFDRRDYRVLSGVLQEPRGVRGLKPNVLLSDNGTLWMRDEVFFVHFNECGFKTYILA